jgi:hypothetical protein
VGEVKSASALIACAVLLSAADARAQSPTYASLYDPLHVDNLNLEMTPADWAFVQGDTTLSVEKPAWLSADGESKLLVAVRRKSESVIGEKISLKIDINEYFDQNTWHGVKKLSLENGFDTDVISEGLAWYMHRVAATLPGDDYAPALASWVNVKVNGSTIGVYASVEQPDKRFLRNRDLWTGGETWLYKGQRNGPHLLEEGPSQSSPTTSALNYSPFNNSKTAPPAGYEAQLETLIDMRGMLVLGAVDAFTANSDNLFNRGHNDFFADVADGKRRYFPWDLDAVFTSTTAPIYGTAHAYQQYILNNPQFRDDYNAIMLELLDGPLSVASLNGFIDQLEPELTPWLLADPNSNIDSVSGEFSGLRNWISARHANVLSQVQADVASSTATPEPAAAGWISMAGALLMMRHRRDA